MAIKRETKHKVRFIMPEIIVIDGKMYKPTFEPDIEIDETDRLFFGRPKEIADTGVLRLEEIISEDE